MNRQTISVLGSIALAIGCFCPLVHLPIVGDVNYFLNGKGDGIIVIVLAGIALLCSLLKRFRVAAVMGWISLVMVGFACFKFLTGLPTVRAEVQNSLDGNPFRGFGEAFIGGVQMGFAWPILFVGAIMLIAVGFMGGKQERAPEQDNVRSSVESRPREKTLAEVEDERWLNRNSSIPTRDIESLEGVFKPLPREHNPEG